MISFIYPSGYTSSKTKKILIFFVVFLIVVLIIVVILSTVYITRLKKITKERDSVVKDVPRNDERVLSNSILEWNKKMMNKHKNNTMNPDDLERIKIDHFDGKRRHSTFSKDTDQGEDFDGFEY